MPMRDRLARLVQRNPERPSLGQRAAALKASAAKVIRRKPMPAGASTDAAEPVAAQPPGMLSGPDAALLRLGQALEAAIVAEREACARADAAIRASGASKREDPEAEAEAEAAGTTAADLARQVAELPAYTADGLRLKIRALIHYNPAAFKVPPEMPDPHQILAHSLRLDAERAESVAAQAVLSTPGVLPPALPGTDAEFLRLEREWDEARAREEAGYARQREIVSADPGPGPAPEGMPEWREFHQKVREWRDSSGLEEAEEDAKHWCGVVDDIAQQIAALPATSLTGMRVKARVLQYAEEIQVDPVSGLVGGLARDVLALAPEALPQDARALALVDALEREWGAWSAGQARDYLDVSAEASARADVRSDRREILLEAAIALPATSRAARHAKALAHAWIGLVESWRYRKPREEYQFDGLLAFDIDAALAGANSSESEPTADPPASAPFEIGIAKAFMQSIDLSELSMRELAALAEDAETLASVAWGIAALPRQNQNGAYTPVVRFFEGVACAAGEIVWRSQKEAKGRTPIGHLDREWRAKAIALPVIEDGNPDDLEALAADLSKEAARLRKGEAEAAALRG